MATLAELEPKLATAKGVAVGPAIAATSGVAAAQPAAAVVGAAPPDGWEPDPQAASNDAAVVPTTAASVKRRNWRRECGVSALVSGISTSPVVVQGNQAQAANDIELTMHTQNAASESVPPVSR